MLHSVLWKDKDLCNLPELNHPLKACQAAFCCSQEVVIPRSISLCWPGESVFLSALLCACWYVLAYRVRLCFGPVLYLNHHKRDVLYYVEFSCDYRSVQSITRAPSDGSSNHDQTRCLFCCVLTAMFGMKTFIFNDKDGDILFFFLCQ